MSSKTSTEMEGVRLETVGVARARERRGRRGRSWEEGVSGGGLGCKGNWGVEGGCEYGNIGLGY